MRKDWKLAAGTLIAAGALAVPASASAVVMARPAVITAAGLAPCYTSVPPNGVASIPITLTGGTPGDPYEVVASYPNTAAGSAGSDSGAAPFDVNGNGAAALTGIFPSNDSIYPLAGSEVDLTAEDFNAADPDPGYVTSPIGSFLVTNLALNVNGEPSNPKKARNVAISGTPFANKQIYGYVTNHARTKVLREFHIGKGNVCGFTQKHEVVDPVHYAAGKYYLFVGPGPKLSEKNSLSEAFTITITKY